MDISESARERLQFEAEVIRNFQYLVSELGFQVTKQDAYLVRYESEKVIVEVFHGLKDYEVGIHFGLVGMKKVHSFTLFLRRFFPEAEKDIGNVFGGYTSASRANH